MSCLLYVYFSFVYSVSKQCLFNIMFNVLRLWFEGHGFVEADFDDDDGDFVFC